MTFVNVRFHLHREPVLQYLHLWTTLTIVTATGDKQSPVKNQIGKVILVRDVLIIGFGGKDSPSSQRGKQVQGRSFDACCPWICRYHLPFRPVLTTSKHQKWSGSSWDKVTSCLNLSNIRAIMDYQYKSICRGGHSIMETIASQGFNPHEYSLSPPLMSDANIQSPSST